MYTYTDVKEILEKEIRALEFPASVPGLYEPAKYLLSAGGKRFRPCMALLSANIFTDDISACIHPALAIEIFHNFTLVHDDILDNAALRRGRATVHEKWDTNTAILSGDMMLVKAYELLSHNAKNLSSCIKVFNKTAIEVCEGQRLDMDFEHDNDVTLADYLHMITLKTSVLLGCSAYIGAMAGGASENDAAHLYNFGKNIGIGFQIHDDLLDIYGDAEKVGKQKAGDILRNKKTYLWLSLMEKLSPQEKIYFDNDILHMQGDENKINAVLELYQKYDIGRLTENTGMQYFETALQALSKVSADENRLEVMKQLCMQIAQRKF